MGQHFRWSSIWMGPFFSKARYMNGVGFEVLARTPVPKLSPSYIPSYPPPPPPPHTHTHTHIPKNQVSLRIRVVCSVFVVRMKKVLHPWPSKMCLSKMLIRLREGASWSESSLGAHVRRYRLLTLRLIRQCKWVKWPLTYIVLNGFPVKPIYRICRMH